MHQGIGIHALLETPPLDRFLHFPRSLGLYLLASADYDVDQIWMLPHSVR